MFIDAENYIILVQTNSHPCERHLIAREDAIGLRDANKIKTRLLRKYPSHLVRIFHEPDRGSRILVD